MLPSYLKRQVALMICSPLLGKIIGFIFKNKIPHGTLFFYTDSPLIAPQTKASIFWGIYEPAELRFINKYLRADLDCIELGSSLGVSSSYIRNRIDKTKKLICIEANPGLADLIKMNISTNCPEKSFHIETRAINYNSSNSVLQLQTVNTTSKITDDKYDFKNSEIFVEVSSTTLDSILNSYQINEYSLVCDIERSEIDIIKFDSNSLKKCKQIIIELHSTKLNDQPLTIEQMKDMIVKDHNFVLDAQYGRVFVFSKQN